MPNPALPGPGTKIHVRQGHHSNQRILFYTHQTTLSFGPPYLTAQHTNLHLPTQCSVIPSPPSRADWFTPSTPVASNCTPSSPCHPMLGLRGPLPASQRERSAEPSLSKLHLKWAVVLGRAMRSLDVCTDNCPLCRRSSSARLGVCWQTTEPFI